MNFQEWIESLQIFQRWSRSNLFEIDCTIPGIIGVDGVPPDIDDKDKKRLKQMGWFWDFQCGSWCIDQESSI